MIKKIVEGIYHQERACLSYGPAVQNNLLKFIIKQAEKIIFLFNDSLPLEVQVQTQMHLPIPIKV